MSESKIPPVQIHFFLMDLGGKLNVQFSHRIPRVGEEVRLRADMIYRVESVLHCYDEKDETRYDRANIKLARVKQ